MQAFHSTASCHLGTARTLRMLERFLLVSWHEHLHTVVASPLPEVSSTEQSVCWSIISKLPRAAFSFARSFRMPPANLLGFGKLPLLIAPTPHTAVVGWSV